MASINKVILVGNLGRDPETRYMPDGAAITNVSIATTDSWKDKASGEKKEATEWHRVVFFNRLAEIAGEYLKKGSQVYVEGRITYSETTGDDGQKRYFTDIVADEMQMLGGREGGAAGGGGGAPREGGFQRSGGGGGGSYGSGGDRQQRAPAQRRDPAPAKPANFDDVPFDDDIPF